MSVDVEFTVQYVSVKYLQHLGRSFLVHESANGRILLGMECAVQYYTETRATSRLIAKLEMHMDPQAVCCVI